MNAVAAADGARVIGSGLMANQDDEAHLLPLAVRADASRRGIGAARVTWPERSARVAGLSQVRLEARLANDAAHAFYARLGDREIQTLPGYYLGRETCVRFAKDLRSAFVRPGQPR